MLFVQKSFGLLRLDFKTEDCTFSSDLIKKNGEDLKKVPISTEEKQKNLKNEIENLNFSIKR